MKRILSGIQPTSGLTLGNYLGSIKQFLTLQNDYEMYIFVADLHALTTNKSTPEELRENSKNLIKSYIACGLDINKVNLFLQSSISEHAELSYLLMCNTTLGELNRMTQFKDKSQKFSKEENGTLKLPTGLLIYPTLMAADILLYSPDFVPVGSDQKQHLELTRNIAERFNKKFKKEIFKIPEPLISKSGARIMDLFDPSVKMSKSASNHKGVIFLNDPIDVSIKKIISAKTDSLNLVNHDYEKQPEITNLVNIYSNLSDLRIEDVVKKYEGQNYKVFKEDLANLLKNFLEEYQNKVNQIDDKVIDEIIVNGYKKVKQIAHNKKSEVYETIGLLKNEQ